MGKIESKQFDYIEEKQKQLLINWKIIVIFDHICYNCDY